MTTYLKQKPVKSCEQFHRKTLVKQANGTTYGGDFIESSIRGSNKKILQTHVFYYATEVFRSFHATEVFMLLSIYYATEVFRSFHATEVFMLLSIYYATEVFRN